MWYLATLVALSFASAEIIDRIAVAVDRDVITESEVMRQVRIIAFLNNRDPDFSPANRRATAERLIEQILIRRELESSRYSPPADANRTEYSQMMQRFKNPDEYKQALAKFQLGDADIRQALEWQATLLDFIDLRFRPGVQIPASEIREYYDQQVASNPGKLPPFDEAKTDIEQILTSQRVDNALDRWLGQARTQSRIRYTQEVFR